jgi:hypothetical protein
MSGDACELLCVGIKTSIEGHKVLNTAFCVGFNFRSL